jgi:hypothetical protein
MDGCRTVGMVSLWADRLLINYSVCSTVLGE